jgi:hypothetical protein
MSKRKFDLKPLNDICPICMEDANPLTEHNSITLNCKHGYHKSCYADLMIHSRDQRPNCSMCREKLPVNNFTRIKQILKNELASAPVRSEQGAAAHPPSARVAAERAAAELFAAQQQRADELASQAYWRGIREREYREQAEYDRRRLSQLSPSELPSSVAGWYFPEPEPPPVAPKCNEEGGCVLSGGKRKTRKPRRKYKLTRRLKRR